MTFVEIYRWLTVLRAVVPAQVFLLLLSQLLVITIWIIRRPFGSWRRNTCWTQLCSHFVFCLLPTKNLKRQKPHACFPANFWNSRSSFSWQMSPISTDFHLELFPPWARVSCCWASTESSRDVVLLTSPSLSQPHISWAESAAGSSQETVLTGWFCEAHKHLEDARLTSIPSSPHDHCWDSEPRLHLLSTTSPVTAASSRHRLCWVL